VEATEDRQWGGGEMRWRGSNGAASTTGDRRCERDGDGGGWRVMKKTDTGGRRWGHTFAAITPDGVTLLRKEESVHGKINHSVTITPSM
jgi:hypothetical protein